MRHIHLSITIDASCARVWRTLCDPAEVVQWDAGVGEALDAPPDYPRPGQCVRWRLRSGRYSELLDEPQEVLPERALRSLLSYGPFRLDETYTLAPTPSGCRLDVDIDASTTLRLASALVERLYLARTVQRDFAASLDAMKRHCETAA